MQIGSMQTLQKDPNRTAIPLLASGMIIFPMSIEEQVTADMDWQTVSGSSGLAPFPNKICYVYPIERQ